MRSADRVSKLLADLGSIAHEAAYVVSFGRDAFLADDAQGQLLRNAGERVIIKVATVVERLPEDFKAERAHIRWTDIQRMRNLVAHHDDKVLPDLVWASLERRVPEFVREATA